MRLLKVEFIGDDLYKDSTFSFDLFASDRVLAPDDGKPLPNVHRVGNTRSVYSQNVIGISGVNASGKTTSVNLLEFASQYLTMTCLIRSDRFATTMMPAKLANHFFLRAVFWHEGHAYAIVSALGLRRGTDGQSWYRIEDEQLYELRSYPLTKTLLSSVDTFIGSSELLISRNAKSGEAGALTEEERTFLRDDMSIAMAVTHRRITDGVSAMGRLDKVSYSTALVNAFDPSVEYLRWDPDSEVYHLKFHDEPERSLSRNAAELQLSYGTLVGSEMVLRAVGILREGGLMIVDEIERGLNKSLVRTIIDLFLSGTTNPHGAQLVFTTHYPEILDFLPRKDDVYLLVRDSSHKTSVIKYSDRVERIENKKSEIVLSNYIKGTLPNYPDIRDLREYVARSVREGSNGE